MGVQVTSQLELLVLLFIFYFFLFLALLRSTLIKFLSYQRLYFSTRFVVVVVGPLRTSYFVRSTKRGGYSLVW